MGTWHINQNGKQLDPVELDPLLESIRSGTIKATDLAWTDGMAEWKAVQDVPILAAALPTGAAAPTAGSLGVMSYQMPATNNPICTQAALQSLAGTKPWVRLIGILLYIFGGLCVLVGLFAAFGAIGGIAGSRPGGSIMAVAFLAIYVVMSLIYILLGVFLNRYASSISALMMYRREDQLEAALESQRKFWRLVGIITLTVIGLYAVGILIAIVVAIIH